MREIKFRAWDKTNKRIVLASTVKMNAICSTELKSLDHQARIVNYILMQYTGLKDKNGVEIYEGDIVKRKRTLFEIRYDLFRFCFTRYKYTTMENYYLTIFDSKELKVIGNIYENSNLVEDKWKS